MKKFLQITAIMLSAVVVSNFVQAQGQTTTKTTIISPASEDVILNVILQPIQTLEVVGKTVNLTYGSKDDYFKGATTEMPGHLSVYSIGGFNVTVQSAVDLLDNSDGGDKKIESSGILITAKKAAGNDLEYSLGTNVPLTSTGAKIVSSLNTALNRSFDITYHGSGEDEYISRYVGVDGKNSIYSTTVTYTISAQ